MTREDAHKNYEDYLKESGVQPIDVMFTKNYQKKRAAKQLEKNPDHFTTLGAIGGSVSGIKKGFSAMSDEQRKEIQAKGIATRLANKKARDETSN